MITETTNAMEAETVEIPSMKAIGIEAETDATAVPCEQRKHPRAKIATEVHLASDSNFFAGLGNNISEGGIFVATYMLLRAGTMADLEFTLPDGGEPVRVQGEVRWVREQQLDRSIMPGMGFRFIDLSEGDRRRIERFVSQRETILYED